MLEIKVRFFGPARDQAGSDETVIQLPDGARVSDALAEVSKRWPSMARSPRLRPAVNRAYVANGHVLQNGDELALIPPVSGG